MKNQIKLSSLTTSLLMMTGFTSHAATIGPEVETGGIQGQKAIRLKMKARGKKIFESNLKIQFSTGKDNQNCQAWVDADPNHQVPCDYKNGVLIRSSDLGDLLPRALESSEAGSQALEKLVDAKVFSKRVKSIRLDKRRTSVRGNRAKLVILRSDGSNEKEVMSYNYPSAPAQTEKPVSLTIANPATICQNQSKIVFRGQYEIPIIHKDVTSTDHFFSNTEYHVKETREIRYGSFSTDRNDPAVRPVYQNRGCSNEVTSDCFPYTKMFINRAGWSCSSIATTEIRDSLGRLVGSIDADCSVNLNQTILAGQTITVEARPVFGGATVKESVTCQ